MLNMWITVCMVLARAWADFLLLQCILSIYRASVHQFYANILVFVVFLYTNDLFALPASLLYEGANSKPHPWTTLVISMIPCSLLLSMQMSIFDQPPYSLHGNKSLVVSMASSYQSLYSQAKILKSILRTYILGVKFLQANRFWSWP